jgi:hypothetical protein
LRTYFSRDTGTDAMRSVLKSCAVTEIAGATRTIYNLVETWVYPEIAV